MKKAHLNSRRAALLFGAVALASCSPAGDEGAGETSYAETLEAAEAGDAIAQYNLGQMYSEGIGVEADPAKAAEWHRKAAEQGQVDAQYNLARSYAHGTGLAQDYAEARKWYLAAARQGDASAQHNLGVMAGQGRGGPVDYDEAVMWFRAAAEQGHAKSQFNLATLVARGKGAERDFVAAHKWFTLAANDRELAEQATAFRAEVEAEMSPDQIGKARGLASAWIAAIDR